MVTKRSVLQVQERVGSAIARLQRLTPTTFVPGGSDVEDAILRVVRSVNDVIDRDLKRAVDELDYLMTMAD